MNIGLAINKTRTSTQIVSGFYHNKKIFTSLTYTSVTCTYRDTFALVQARKVRGTDVAFPEKSARTKRCSHSQVRPECLQLSCSSGAMSLRLDIPNVPLYCTCLGWKYRVCYPRSPDSIALSEEPLDWRDMIPDLNLNLHFEIPGFYTSKLGAIR